MKEEKLLMFKNYLLEGHNIKIAAKKSNINYKSTYSIIKRYNLTVINKGQKNLSISNYFDEVNTENKAYILGFFIADGYIEKSTNRICFNNSIDDLEIFKIINKEICPDSKILYFNKRQGAEFRKEQVSLRFTNKKLKETLEKRYGIFNNKTHNEKYMFDFGLIPKELLHHFIRGYFDGDGSVSFSIKKNIFFNFSFVFNSEIFANQFAYIFNNQFNIKSVIYNHKGKTCNYYSLRFNYDRKRQEKIKEIYNWLYKDATIYLNRKKIKFEQYINTELTPGIKRTGTV